MENKSMNENTVYSTKSSPKLNLRTIDGFGFKVFAPYPVDAYESALKYRPLSGDCFVVTYPKCGTTWVQHIMVLIFRHGEPIRDRMEFLSATPVLEMAGAEGVKVLPRPLCIKTHIPYHLIPKSSEAKYVYIARNPKDCCVSFYHYVTDKHGPHKFTGSFDEFFEMFISGKVNYGDFFDHLLGWYSHRNDPNVFFLTYEQLKENTEEMILKMASFLGDKLYAEPLRNDPEKLRKVLKYSSFDHMKKTVNKALGELFSMPKEQLQKSEMPKPLKETLEKLPCIPTGVEVNFIRKGTIGDWRNYLSEEQSKRLDEKLYERTKGTDIPDLWKKYM